MARRLLNRKASYQVGKAVLILVGAFLLIALGWGILEPIITESSKTEDSIMLSDPVSFEEGEIEDVTKPATITLEAINIADSDEVELPEGAVIPDGAQLLEFFYKIDNPDGGQGPLFIPENDYFLLNDSGQVLYSGMDFDRDYTVAQREGRSDYYSLYFPIQPDTTFYIAKLNNNSLLKQVQNIWKFTPENDGYQVSSLSQQETDQLGINYQLIKDYMDAHDMW